MDVKSKSFIAPNRWALAFVLALLFGLGLGIRLTDLTDLPLDFHPTRQLFSATITLRYKSLTVTTDD